MLKRRLALLVLAVLVLTACVPSVTSPPAEAPTSTAAPSVPPTSEPPTSQPLATTPAPTAAAPEGHPLYVAIIWHQHQPVYYKDPETGLYAKPWVRVHASKDYVDMAAILERYPDLHVTFNLTPSLIRQLDDIASGARDRYWMATEIPADGLSDEDKAFLRDRFFDINPKVVARFPRYQEIADDRANSAEWDVQTWRDLQVLFNLGWTDPDWLAEEPLKALVDKGRRYSEEDKAVVLSEHLRLVQGVIPIHKRLQEAGQIEVTMTPYAHPILPLLIDSSLARSALPKVDLPASFSFPEDAVAQVERGIELYQDHFGIEPKGMWPAEGSVAQEMVGLVGRAGLTWMASDEGVLAKSLEMAGFARDSNETVQEADALYRPYYVSDIRAPSVAIVFRDRVISDKVGFTYSGMPGDQAAADFMQRLHNIRDHLEASSTAGPHLVSVILDGENAWEYYDNDGKEFLHSLYQGLSDDPTLKTVTPSEFLALAPVQPEIETLWNGSWIDHSYATWIGEEEENSAWGYLGTARAFLQEYQDGRRQASDEAIASAYDAMMIAEGSDWFWWYGSDQDSGSDRDFDGQFRDTLKQVYRLLGAEVPDYLEVPVIPQDAQDPQAAATALITPTIDGQVDTGEWEGAGTYAVAGGAMASAGDLLTQMSYGFDATTLYLRYEFRNPLAEIMATAPLTLSTYLKGPSAQAESSFSRYGRAEPRTLLGFGANLELAISLHPDEVGMGLFGVDKDGRWSVAQDLPEGAAVGARGSTVEIALPLVAVGPVDSGTVLFVRGVLSQSQKDSQVLPPAGPARVVVPDLGLTATVLEVLDAAGDDSGPGSYTYPTDGVFGGGAFDLTSFSVGYDETNIVFKIVVGGPVDNPWNSPNGLSVQTLDIYIDQDGPANGARMLLPGRNAALSEDHAWDYAIWAEGWYPGIYRPGTPEPEKVDAELTILVEPDQSKISVKVPRELLGDDPQSWAYTAVLLGQEGYPATGVWRVRDVEGTAQQWRFGGAPDDTNHTRIIDLAWPSDVTPTQAEILGLYPASRETDLGRLGAGDFCQIPMVSQ